MAVEDIVLEPPIAGHWVIYNPPGHPSLAIDLLAEDRRQSLYRKGSFLRHLFSFIPAEDTHTWARPVYSPVEGTVVVSHDTEEDRKKICFLYDLVSLMARKPVESSGFGAFGGNHIMIQSGGYYVLLCHLKKGSSRVKPGDALIRGRQVGEVGNSGSSIQPHLHVQVMSNDRYFPLYANLIPFRFSRGRVKEGVDWIERANVIPTNRTHYLFNQENAP